jgi:two-component system response regulator YesN
MKNHRIKKALILIDENIDKDLPLQKLATHFKLSKNYFSQLFKKEMKIRFSKYLIQARIKKAKKLLRTSSMSVKAISRKVGYKYVLNFEHDFKKKTRLTPLEYKKNRHKVMLLKLKQLVLELKRLLNSI